ncbi:hypothetical protein BCR33DRAFT_721093 [Rhizoclosmatium globosum]|uniref:Uncharacterized protein n=1 Tax=Rhizoclosmatium globosum TaxID=329046 RepID=A0A1Y2BT15_9FUNG|nr:hypothetical protein BCR33DRAFT_721093 [Rhizoclosmatium globosum]|eukprot:ORY37889.1 hypothetical protein BCR33DRAFT_721093 [Rhizoclosmatium globosum]
MCKLMTVNSCQIRNSPCTFARDGVRLVETQNYVLKYGKEPGFLNFQNLMYKC